MKPLIEISNYEEFVSYLSKLKSFSYEVSSKGLVISSTDLNIRLLVDLKNLKMINNKLLVFNQDFITVQDDFNFNQCNKYISKSQNKNMLDFNSFEQTTFI